MWKKVANFYRMPESNWDALVAHEDLSGYLVFRGRGREAGGGFCGSAD